MVNWAPALSIADLASEWVKETGEAKLECALARSFINGKLMVSDPEMDRWCYPFWDDVEIKDFLQANKNYSEHYYASGDGVIFNNEYWLALDEIANYGKAVTGNLKTAEMALSNLFVKKEDFRKWLRNSDRKMPAFWLSESERATNDSTKSADKPLATTERNTLLTIIAALCDYSAIKHQERGAAGEIAKMTEELGAAVTDDTIRKVLAKIPNALETRMK